jgi:hypothetical protein
MRGFTTQEFVDQRIPRLSPLQNDFRSALDLYNKQFISKYLGDGIVTAFPYGSLLVDPNCTSDADCLLIFDNIDLEEESSQLAGKQFVRKNLELMRCSRK